MIAARRVCVESPFAGDVTRNVAYADVALLDCLRRGEAPFLGHLLYPRVLDDGVPLDREQGIAAHCTWLRAAEVVAVYCDLGISSGMTQAMNLATALGIVVEQRWLGESWPARVALLRRTHRF